MQSAMQNQHNLTQNQNQKGKRNNTQKRVGQLNKSGADGVNSVNPFETDANKSENKFKEPNQSNIDGKFVPASMQPNKNDMKDSSQRGFSQIFNSNSSLQQLSQLFNLGNLKKVKDKKMF